MHEYFVIFLSFGLSILLVSLQVRYASVLNLIDRPNQRSSHMLPTASGGGLAILVGFLASLIVFSIFNSEVFSHKYIILIGACGLVIVGYMDDLFSVSISIRLAVQFIASYSVLYAMQFSPPLNTSELAYWKVAIPVLGLAMVWLINLYNFMDGIDGLAASQTVFVCIFAGCVLLYENSVVDAFWLLLLAAATSGFLVFNWPKASIFMGDSGSSFIGFFLACLILHTSAAGSISVFTWLILLALFICDSTAALLRRLLAKVKFWKPHRSHAYQNMARRFDSHKLVTLSFILTNTFVLGPIALVAHFFPDIGAFLTVSVYLPLFAMALWAGSGVGGLYEGENEC